MPIDFQPSISKSSRTRPVPMSPCKNAWLPFARVATPGLFSGAKIAPFFSHKMCDELKKRCHNAFDNEQLRCQVGRVGSCVTTMAALAARIERNTYTYHIRATCIALRLSAVQNLLHSCFGGLCGASLMRIHAVAPSCGSARHRHYSGTKAILYC